MINMAHISNIQNRIREIQDMVKVGPQLPGAEFEKSLQKEIRRIRETGKTAEAQTSAEVKQAQEKSSAGNAPAAQESSALAVGGDGSSFSDMIAAAAQKYDVDPKLVSAVAEAESGGDQSAVSHAGAVGVMQLMPDTAAALGVDPYDKAQNIEGGAKYLRQMLDNFGGDVKKAVAAYNAGPQAVRDYGGVPPYAETQNYVEHVLDLYQ